MEAEFWLELWRNGRTGFHRDAPLPWLTQYWPLLALPKDARVLVPLAGKTPAMNWLANQGYRVLGVELSPLAVQQFLEQNNLAAEVHESDQGTHHVTDLIEIIQGDIFSLTDTTLATCEAIYDRAAMIALPPDMRERYGREIYGRLPAHCRGLLVTYDYAQSEMKGPPFSVDKETVSHVLGDHWQIQELDRADKLGDAPHFREAGLTSLETTVYRLDHHA